MNGVNKHILIGNVGRDPEFRGTGPGRSATFSIATSESWRDKASGERKEMTTWHRIVVYDERLVELIDKYVRKGSKLFLVGKVLHRQYKDAGGIDRTITETVLKSFGGELQMLDRADRAPDPGDEESHMRSAARPPRDLDDEVPF